MEGNKLKCYPICEYGHIFYDMVSTEAMVQESENYHRLTRYYNPSACPQCGVPITGIELKKEDYFGTIDFRKMR